MIDFFTKQEKSIIAFLMAGLLIGSGLRLFFSKERFKANSQQELNLLKKQIIEKSKKIDSLINADNKITTKSKKASIKRQTAKLKKKSVDINEAGFDELILLPNVGPVLANRIIEFRRTKGRFNNMETL